jgi:hypothetical protein
MTIETSASIARRLAEQIADKYLCKTDKEPDGDIPNEMRRLMRDIYVEGFVQGWQTRETVAFREGVVI